MLLRVPILVLVVLLQVNHVVKCEDDLDKFVSDRATKETGSAMTIEEMVKIFIKECNCYLLDEIKWML
jgi:hypothetical protein